MSDTFTYEHKGYILQQTSYNWHYMIIDPKTDRMVLHAACTEKLTEDEAKEAIEGYLKLTQIDWGEDE